MNCDTILEKNRDCRALINQGSQWQYMQTGCLSYVIIRDCHALINQGSQWQYIQAECLSYMIVRDCRVATLLAMTK